MSFVLTCYKHVINEEDILVNADLSISTDRAERKISDYDKNAIEAGKQIAEELGANFACLTYGSEKARPSVKDALSRGPEEAFFVNDASADTADALVTGEVLAAAVSKIDDVKIVVCADGSADVFQKQTAPRIAAKLDWPVIINVISMKIEDGSLVVVQKLDDATRTIKVTLPCVVAVSPEINTPPTPGMRACLNAGKKPVTEWTVADLDVTPEAKTQVSKIEGFVMQRKNVIFSEGSPAEKVDELVAALKKEGVL